MADRHRLALITPSLSKDDRTDAEHLAELGLRRPEMLNPIQPASLETQSDRTVLKAREALVEVRTKLINSVRGTRGDGTHAACRAQALRLGVLLLGQPAS